MSLIDNYRKGLLPDGSNLAQRFMPRTSDEMFDYQGFAAAYFGSDPHEFIATSGEFAGKHVEYPRPGEGLKNESLLRADYSKNRYLTLADNINQDKGFTASDYLIIGGMAALPFAVGAITGASATTTAGMGGGIATEAGAISAASSTTIAAAAAAPAIAPAAAAGTVGTVTLASAMTAIKTGLGIVGTIAGISAAVGNRAVSSIAGSVAPNGPATASLGDATIGGIPLLWIAGGAFAFILLRK